MTTRKSKRSNNWPEEPSRHRNWVSRRLGWFSLRFGLGLGLVHGLARGRGDTAIPEQLVLRLSGPSRIPALATIDNPVGPMTAVTGDPALEQFRLDDRGARRPNVLRQCATPGRSVFATS
jgi:hypothetical protein